MKREFDWTQEFQETMNGRKVRILCRDARGQFPIVGIIIVDLDTDRVMRWTEDGHAYKNGLHSPVDLRPLPTKKQVRWENCYPEGEFYTYSSREEADRHAASDRIACIRVEYAEGQFDE